MPPAADRDAGAAGGQAAPGSRGDAPPLADALRIGVAAWVLFRGGVSLDRALDRALERATDPVHAVGGARLHPRAAAAARDLVYDATRRLALVEALVAQLASRPPEHDAAALLALALAQLVDDRHAPYTIVDQAVEAAKRDPALAPRGGFVNAVLRNFVRRRHALLADVQRDDTVRFNAPRWWIDRLRAAWPQDWQAILQSQSARPPLVLRVNVRRLAVEAYLERLAAEGIEATRVGPAAVWLHAPRPVDRIPGFAAGDVSVQDAGAQLAAPWLAAHLRAGGRVLDACAAPGGKSAHLAEIADARIDAVERDGARAERIGDNARRLGFPDRIAVFVEDAVDFARAAGAARYDAVLLDAPCTASGIVRRHPDIPWLRRPADVVQLATEQRRLLDALWPCVAPAGRLLYVVCSVFPDECTHQVDRFVRMFGDARPVALAGTAVSQQTLLPSPISDSASPWRGAGLPTQHDGFFYALFEKT
jgi:16S rRNA (cytosine967-C5)-methyltransferase